MVFVIKVNDFQGIGSGGRRLPFMVPAFKNFLVEMVKNDKKHYCEHNSLFLAVNIPFIFRALFSAAQSFLTKRQAAKIRLLGDTSQPSIREMLKRLVPESILPRDYGGVVTEATGAFPLASEADIDEWYRTRHLLSNEKPEADSAASAGLVHNRSQRSEVSQTSTKTSKSRTSRFFTRSHKSSQSKAACESEDVEKSSRMPSRKVGLEAEEPSLNASKDDHASGQHGKEAHEDPSKKVCFCCPSPGKRQHGK